ncbi:glycoside hydrolase family 97 protein [Chitinophaga horti]|uniref:Glycoside hydrolase family 97 protein n=1 Tax=Chitinophaga horti TaxID=2920382 RepID=A0ABY6IX83_9BACT|nr:glycoside hydrolase family 97 protein [Chitinophaga horti]UYQ91012.1 glycoside hydrolase family 97 protein [Chitinophaga horti]
MSITKSLAAAGLLLLQAGIIHAQQPYQLQSPDGKIKVEISVSDSVYYTVHVDGKALTDKAAIGLQTSAAKAGPLKVKSWKTSGTDAILEPIVWQKSKTITDKHNHMRIDLTNGLSLEWRAYNEGIAWHWLSSHKGNYTVLAEQAGFRFDPQGRSWYPQEDEFFSHNERLYKNYRIDSIDQRKLASLPALFDVKGVKVLLTESDLFNYPGMWLRGKGDGRLGGVFPAYPKEKKITSDRDEKVTARENYLARVNGPQSFPWRIMMIAREDKDLLANQLPYLLARPAKGDYSWIKPGKVQWDWWHYNNVYNVDFESGINNATYKYYIDVAAKYGIEYVLLDEGWCDTRDLLKLKPGIDIAELSAYAKSKGVDLLLWSSWLVLDKQLDTALDQFRKWGIKGIKVDFMQRDDQEMVNYYERVAKAAAARHMLVDFHGAYKPTGWLRSMPNVMTSEGVFGNEISKFAGSITPEHTATLPFTRMAAGPMDFTPGGMVNVQKDQFAVVPAEPNTLGTRCNQMAMYVVFESPLQMLCDIPTHYLREPECMQFLGPVPAVWQQTVPLQSKVGDYVAIARQAPNGNWYVGAMTDWSERELDVKLDFLPAGNYKVSVWKDGVNANKNAKDYKMETLSATNATNLHIKMAKGGGYVAVIEAVK